MAPKIGKHFTYASENRKAPSYVQAQQLIRRRFKNAKKIHLVQDNLSTHTEASCIKALGMKEGTELRSKFVVH